MTEQLTLDIPAPPKPRAPMVTLINDGCLEAMRRMPDNSVDAIVTDPPYGLSNTTPAQVAETLTKWVTGDREYLPAGKGFMGADWDAFVPPVAVWDEALRVLKPGGHLLAFAGTRTMDLMTLGIRLAGFDIRDSIAWLYGSGFPKSMDVSKAIDKAAISLPLWNDVRDHLRKWQGVRGLSNRDLNAAVGGALNGGGRASAWLSEAQQKPELPSKAQWETLREALRWEPCELDDLYDAIKDGATRPVIDMRATSRTGGAWSNHENAGMFRAGEVKYDITAPATPEAQRWEGWGTALKPAFEPVVVARKPLIGTVAANVLEYGTGALNIDSSRIAHNEPAGKPYTGQHGKSGGIMGETVERHRSTDAASTAGRFPANVILDESQAAALDQQSGNRPSTGHNPSAVESDGGLFGHRKQGQLYADTGGASRFFYCAKAPKAERPVVDGVAHATVKPLALMRYLVRLVTPPGGVVLEPFAGSGTTMEACVLEGFDVIGVERDPRYLPLIQERLRRNG